MSGRAVAMLLTMTVLVGACSGDEATTICEPAERQEPQFPQGHVLPDTPEPTYLSEPPTSGPHLPVAPDQIVFDDPLPRPAQVGVLERGAILVQYRDPRDGDAAEAVADDAIVVAPNPDLGHPVVLSAWLVLQRCPGLDADSVELFLDEHGDRIRADH